MFRTTRPWPALLLAAAFLTAAAPAADAGIDARLLRFPDVSQDRIAFVYAGDIWIAPKAGGQAVRLSTPAGEEAFPRFSPDGRWIAFSGNYDGNTDIYVMPVTGGVPRRLTHHPMDDRMLDWYPDGKHILYATSMHSGKQRFRQLYKLSVEGGAPQKLPVPYGEFGSISADGKKLAYMPVSRDFRTWKRYRGGSTTDVWIFDLENFGSTNITTTNSNDGQPMWHGDTLYFQSDRDENKRSNIWAYDTKSGRARQLTNYKEYDTRFPAIGPDALVFENGGRLFVMDLATESAREVEIEVVTDKATLKPRRLEVGNWLRSGDLSPTGKRAVVMARGEVFTVPAEHGPIVNLTRTSGVAERDPVWSPDGKEIAYFSDRSGEYELTVRPADGKGEETTLTKLGPGFRYNPQWSPDSKKIVFVDQAMKVRLFDRDSGSVKEIDQGHYWMHGSLSGFSASWSSDSRWLTYAIDGIDQTRRIVLYDTSKGERHVVTSGFYDDADPVFDPDGKYLYFRTARSFSPSYSNFDNSWIYANSTRLAAVPLRADVPSPLAPRNDAEAADGEDDDENGDGNGEEENGDKKSDGKKGKKDDARKDGKDDGKKGDDEKKKPVEIDLDGFESRVVILPPENGNYGNLDAVSGKLVYVQRPNTGADGQPSIKYYDLKKRESETILENSFSYTISADGKKMLVAQNGRFGIIDVAPKQKLEKPLRTSELSMILDPMAEWKQMFDDVWRIERDYFYDPNMHGVDWDAMRTRYGKLVDDAVTRWDLNFILGELIAELNASHAYRGGGDTENEPRDSVGLLGADYTLENGAYRIERIVRAAPWDTEVRSPLDRPGVEVKEGDYVLAVNGAPIDASRDIWASFQGLADRTVQLTVNDKPTMEGARDVLVETLSDETRLRNLAWIESNRKKVEEATGGRVGYIYVPSTGIDGQDELVRMFYGQFMKEGLIVDERFNNGGQIPDRFVELLNRPLYNYWGVRDGRDWQWPPIAHHGPKVMLMNEWSGSGGDCFPFYFRQAGLGPLIGTRTWGGLIGISGAPGLVDGGTATVPTFGIYSVDGEWIIENYGVDPDIEVDDDPSKMVDGGDPQLDRAIEEILRLLKENPPVRPKKPAYPDRSGY